MARVILEPHDVPDEAGALASSGRDWKLAMRLAANRSRVLMASTGLIRPEGADTMNLLSTWAQRLRRSRTVERASAIQQLQALGDVLQQAAALAPSAERTVRACGQAGPVLGTVAQRGGYLISQYERLGRVLADVPVDEQYAPLAHEIAILLRYHQWLIHASLELAFARNPSPRSEAMRLRLNGLGTPATRLDDVRLEVSRLLAAIGSTPVNELTNAPQHVDIRRPSDR